MRYARIPEERLIREFSLPTAISNFIYRLYHRPKKMFIWNENNFQYLVYRQIKTISVSVILYVRRILITSISHSLTRCLILMLILQFILSKDHEVTLPLLRRWYYYYTRWCSTMWLLSSYGRRFVCGVYIDRAELCSTLIHTMVSLEE